jgi:uncharacterized repeat protein (TIGR01451 family)
MFRTVLTAVSALSLSFLAATAPAHAQAADASPLKSELAAFTVSVDSEGREAREPADRVIPGGLIEYELSYENVGGSDLSGLVINGQIPDSTVFVNETASASAPATFEVLVGDLGWVAYPPVRYVESDAGTLVAEPVGPEEFQSVRWVLADSLQPGERVEARYRTRVAR